VTGVVKGVRLGVAQAGIKTADRDDVILIGLGANTQTAAVFTQNAFRAAPVQLAESHLEAIAGQAAFLLVNTGNANAGTGAQGISDAERCCAAVAKQAATPMQQILPFSTGVIGEAFPTERVVAAVPHAFSHLSERNWEQAAAAILTTDTRPKLRSARIELDGGACTITGIAKGAGMICPNLATMLAFIATDAEIENGMLDRLLKAAVNASFNRITVDGDTSTNDAVTLSATGESGVYIAQDSPHFARFAEALTQLMIELAQDIVRDGEGASKFVEIRVSGGETSAVCDTVARTIAHSPLVKTALFASDPNWGRILAAIGRAGVDNLDTDSVAIHINGTLIAEGGARATSYSEERGVEAMQAKELVIEVMLNRGDAASTVWTTDLSYDYVKINAEYRT
jgi:glutamate N-acetyltransferase / amino-acid N-acetyltransferase